MLIQSLKNIRSRFLSKCRNLAVCIRIFLKSIPGFPFFCNYKIFKLRNLSNGSIPNFSPFIYDLQSILKGKLITLDGQILPITSAEDFWQKTLVNHDVMQEVHSFHWLPFLNKIGDHFYMKAARQITLQWIKENKDTRSPAWLPKITAVRLMNWAQNYHFLMSSSDDKTKSSLHRSFTRQLFYLMGEEKYLLKSNDLIPVIYAIIRLIPKSHRIKLANRYINHLEKCSALTPEHLENLPPDEIVENLLYISKIKLLMQVWEIQNLGCLDRGILHCRQLLNNMIHANGALATFNGKVPYSNEFIKTILSDKDAVQVTANNRAYLSRIIKIVSEPSSILIDTGDFRVEDSDLFFPINFEYSSDQQVLISGAAVCIENRSFHGKDKVLKESPDSAFKTSPITHEVYEENKNTWFDGSTRWKFLGETFALTRQIYLCRGGQELRCEDRVSHSYGFATFLLFSIPESLKLTKLKEVNGFVMEEALPQDKKKAQKWAWYFSKESKYQISDGEKYPINGTMQTVKHIIISCSRDYDHTVSRWSLRRL